VKLEVEAGNKGEHGGATVLCRGNLLEEISRGKLVGDTEQEVQGSMRSPQVNGPIISKCGFHQRDRQKRRSKGKGKGKKESRKYHDIMLVREKWLGGYEEDEI